MSWKVNSGSGMSAAACVAGLAVGSLPTTCLPKSESDLKRIDILHSAETADANLTVILEDDGARNRAATEPELRIPSEQDWEEDSEARFEALARKEALGTISQSEYVELENLTRTRRNAREARSGLEIVEAYYRGRHVARMLEALRGYVDFEKGPHLAR